MRLTWLENAYFFTQSLFWRTALTHKVGKTGLVLVCEHGSLVGLCIQDYTTLCEAVTICATLINTQTRTHAHTDRQHLDQLI